MILPPVREADSEGNVSEDADSSYCAGAAVDLIRCCAINILQNMNGSPAAEDAGASGRKSENREKEA